MLTIRPQQLPAILSSQLEHLAARLTEHLARHFPHAGSAEADLLERSREILRRGETLGLRSTQAFFRFANLHATLGWNCLDDPVHDWIAEWLADSSRGEPDQRLAAVTQRLMLLMARKATS